MKKCQVCNALCFDDMKVCYGCLHRFDKEDENEKTIPEQMSEALDNSGMLKIPATEAPLRNSGAREAVRPAKAARQAGASERIDDDQIESKLRRSAHRRNDRGADKNAIAVGQAMALSAGDEAEWVLRLGIPKGGEGVTVRLERAMAPA